ncbi:hypothetical protein CBL_03236 [Carabus blaptoides fortunei]
MEDFFRWTIIGMTPMGLWPLPNKPLAEFWKLCIAHINNFFEACMIAIEINKFNYNSCEKLHIYQRDLVRDLPKTIGDLYENIPLPKMDERIAATTLKWKKRTDRLMYEVAFLLYFAIPSLLINAGNKRVTISDTITTRHHEYVTLY